MNLMYRNRDLALDSLADFARLFNFGFDGAGLFDESLAPAMDMVEHDDDYTVYIDLPGVDKKDLELSVENNVLSIKGVKKEPSGNRKFFRKETWTGEFRRTVSLPAAADSQKVSAELKDGVLSIAIGKREELKPRQISVNVQ